MKKKDIEALRAEADKAVTDWRAATAAKSEADRAFSVAHSANAPLMDRTALEVARLEAEEALWNSRAAAQAALEAAELAEGDADATAAHWPNIIAELKLIRERGARTDDGIDPAVRLVTMNAEANACVQRASKARSELMARRSADGLPPPCAEFNPNAASSFDFWNGVKVLEAQISNPKPWNNGQQLRLKREELTRLRASAERECLKREEQARKEREWEENKRAEAARQAAKQRAENEALAAKYAAERAEEQRLADAYVARMAGQSANAVPVAAEPRFRNVEVEEVQA